MKTALVLSGGGANGAYQVGVLDRLYQKGIQFDVVAGVSVGALNGAMVAQNKFNELLEIWHTITEDQVFRKYSELWTIVRVLFGSRSLYDLSPLKKMIQQHVKLEDLKMPFYCGMVDMESGSYLSGSHYDTEEELQDAVYCSSIMPCIWAPSQYMGMSHFADGGLRNIAPLADVISELPDKIYVVATQPEHLTVASLGTFVKDLKRVIEIFCNEIVNNDVDKLATINDLVLQAREQGALLVNKKTGKSYKYFDFEFIRPDAPLGDATDFSREHLTKCFNLGVRVV